MNHYVGLLITSFCIATVFSLIARETGKERIRYFLKLMLYMAVGSLMTAWLMYVLSGEVQVIEELLLWLLVISYTSVVFFLVESWEMTVLERHFGKRRRV